MSRRRSIARIAFLVSLALLLGGVLQLSRTAQHTCLGLSSLANSPEESQYEYSDYSDYLFFHGEKAPIDVDSSTIYVSQSITNRTSFADLQGHLTCSYPKAKMYFLEDPLFSDLASAAAESHPFTLFVFSGNTFMTLNPRYSVFHIRMNKYMKYIFLF